MTLYYNNAELDSAWYTLGNWWQDAAHTIPAVALPSAIDDIEVAEQITALGAPRTVANAIFVANLEATDSPLTVTGVCTFNGSSQNNGAINGVCTFNGSSQNNGAINGACTFNDTSQNAGTINGDCTFNDASTNAGSIIGNGTFNGSSLNTGAIDGNAIFTSQAAAAQLASGILNGSVSGTVTILTANLVPVLL